MPPLCDFVAVSPSCDFIVILPSCDFITVLPSCDCGLEWKLLEVAPLCLAGFLFFHRMSFEQAPLRIVGCLFFHRVSFKMSPFVFCEVPLFSSDVS
jgi:hypothetical protein